VAAGQCPCVSRPRTPKRSGPPLNLDQFILALSRTPAEELVVAELLDWSSRLQLDDDLVAGHTRFDDGGYARNLLCRTPSFELLVLCWRPGQFTTIHDHAVSLNTTRVMRGALTSRLFDGAGDTRPSAESPAAGPVRRTSTVVLEPGESTAVAPGEIHQLGNESHTDLVTLHVYAPPLTEIRVYSLDDPGVSTVGLRYTLVEVRDQAQAT
jgi:cysteine dioxygenase